MSTDPSLRLLIIGLDGASPQLLFERFRPSLPAISQLLDTSIWGELESVLPATSLPAWPALFSGRDPGELGIYGARQRTGHSYGSGHPVTSRSVNVERIWDLLAREHLQSVIVGAPPSYPPRPVLGVSVGCVLTPTNAPHFTWPMNLSTTIRERFPHYTFDLREHYGQTLASALQESAEITRQHFELVRFLIAAEQPACAVVVDPTLDRLQHLHWDHPEALLQHCQLLDRQIAETLEILSPNTAVLLISDHGARASLGGFAVNDWLIQQGLLKLTEMPPSPALLTGVSVDWQHTTAWAEGSQVTRITLNVTGRESQGTVEPRSYDRVRNEIKRLLESLTGANGRTMSNRAHKPEEVFVRTAGVPPDLICTLGGMGYRPISSVGHQELFLSPMPNHSMGNHAEHGIFMLHWPHHGPNGKRQGIRLLDVFPTLLSVLELKSPATLTGVELIA
ncbi:MAG: alkaline phosphatase family protein [Chloroflexi bacterium]|nr:alkaline phosphatase family protein [Chloroflexota bacterium]